MSESIREKIYNKIRRDIIIGNLAPGERLIESKLSEELHVSRGSIREALRQLTTEGFLTFQTNKGISVSKLTVKQVDEIYALRSVLEGYAVRLATENITKKNLKHLAEMQASLVSATENESLTNWTDSNIAFHNFFIENSGNSYLIQQLDGLRCRTYRYGIITITTPGAKERFLKDHKRIIEECERGKAELAERCMNTHIENVKKILINYLKELSMNALV